MLPYLAIFGLLSLQDRVTGAQTVSYTELTTQVEARNVQRVFFRGQTIQGSLRTLDPFPGRRDAPTRPSSPSGRCHPCRKSRRPASLECSSHILASRHKPVEVAQYEPLRLPTAHHQ